MGKTRDLRAAGGNHPLCPLIQPSNSLGKPGTKQNSGAGRPSRMQRLLTCPRHRLVGAPRVCVHVRACACVCPCPASGTSVFCSLSILGSSNHGTHTVHTVVNFPLSSSFRGLFTSDVHARLSSSFFQVTRCMKVTRAATASRLIGWRVPCEWQRSSSFLEAFYWHS